MELITVLKLACILALIWQIWESYGDKICELFTNLRYPRVVQATENDFIPRYGRVYEYSYEGGGICKLFASSKGYNDNATFIIDNILQIELDKDGTNYYMLNAGEQRILKKQGIPYDYRSGRYVAFNQFYTDIIEKELGRLETELSEQN